MWDHQSLVGALAECTSGRGLNLGLNRGWVFGLGLDLDLGLGAVLDLELEQDARHVG